MSDKIFDLYGQVALKGQKEVENGLKNVENAAKNTGKQMGNSFVNSSGKLKGFRESLNKSEGGLGRFADRIADASGATGAFGNHLGQLGEAMLSGGALGIGLTAAAAGMAYLIQKAEETSKAMQKVISDMFQFRSATKDLKFEIGPENIDRLIEGLQASKELTDLQQQMLGQYGAIGEEVLRWFNTSLYLTDEQLTQYKLSDELLTKLKEINKEEQLRLEAKKLANDLGIKELTADDITLQKLTENRKRRGEIKVALEQINAAEQQNGTLTQEQIDRKKILQKENLDLYNQANSMLGIEKQTVKEAKTLDELEKERVNNIRKGVQEEKNRLTQLRAQQIDVRAILSQTSLDTLLEDFKKWKEKQQKGSEFTIEAVTKMVDAKKPTAPDVSVSSEDTLGFETAEDFLEASDAAKILMEANQAVAQSYEDIADAISMVQGAFGEHTAMYKAAAIIEATVATFLAATKALATVPFPFGFAAAAAITAAGIANIAKITGAATGGTFENGRKVAGFAGGGDFMVPNYFADDTFPIRVRTGERVQVTPTGRVGDEARILSRLAGKLDAVNKNLANVQSEIRSQQLEVNIDGKNLVKKSLKPAENRLIRSGVKLEELI